MPLHVVDTECRHTPTESQAAGQGGANHQGSHQARAGGISHAVYILRAETRFIEHLFQQRQRLAHVVPGSQFRDHAAVLLVHRDLAVQCVREQAGLAVVERDARLVTGSFDAQHPQWSDLFKPARMIMDRPGGDQTTAAGRAAL